MSKSKLVGRMLGDMHYIHRSAIQYLNSGEKIALDLASNILYSNSDKIYHWNLLKVSRKLDKISLLKYQDFEQHLFPCLEYAVIIDISANSYKEIDYSIRENPPILHRQELMLAPTDPRIESLSNVTAFCESHNLFEKASYIGTRNKWYQRLEERGYIIDGFGIRVRDDS